MDERVERIRKTWRPEAIVPVPPNETADRLDLARQDVAHLLARLDELEKKVASYWIQMQEMVGDKTRLLGDMATLQAQAVAAIDLMRETVVILQTRLDGGITDDALPTVLASVVADLRDFLPASTPSPRWEAAEWAKVWIAFQKGEEEQNFGLMIEARARLNKLARAALGMGEGVKL